MTKQTEALKLALDKKAENARELGLDYEPENTLHWHALNYRTAPTQNAQKMFAALEKFVEDAIKEALAQPEFIKHEVENVEDWSEWVCPNPKRYLMQCCDCGLVHEAQFGVVRYKSETEREDCDMVDDPNLQAVFRMRRSEQWSPEDTAHRAGGLPMAQPEQEPATKEQIREAMIFNLPLYTTPPQRTWVGLTEEEINKVLGGDIHDEPNGLLEFVRAIEAKLKEKNFS